MKKILIALCLTLCAAVSGSAQSARDMQFEQQCDSINRLVNVALKNNDNQRAEQECLQVIKLLDSRPEATRQLYSMILTNLYYNLACFQSLQNKKSEAIQSLELAYQHDYRNYRHILQDTDLNNLRDEQGFKNILARIREKGDYLYILQKAPGYQPNQQQTDTLPRFTYANPSDSNLVRVRRYFRLDSVAGAGNELSKIKNILTYIHDKIQHDGLNENPPTANAIGLAEACKDGSRGLNCRGLATVLNECYLSMGFKSRFVTCMPKEYINDCHVINTVYSDSLDKWIWVDPTQNAWVTDENGTMLGIHEVRERLRNGQPLILNEEANWNNRNRTTAEEYLYDYMAKNLYYVVCSLRSQYGTEDRAGNSDPVRYVSLMPVGYTNEREKNTLIVNDPDWFWQPPSTSD